MRLLVDNSVWQRSSRPGVLDSLRKLGPKDSIVTTTPQILEFCHSARSPSDYDEFQMKMAALDLLPLDNSCHDVALQIQRSLWQGGFVRGAGAFDILIAAIAHRHGATLVHYDKNFATIARAVPGFQQRWIAPPGTID